MIPASYLFKSAYHQAWEYQDMAPSVRVVPVPRNDHIDGLFSPIAAVITLLHRATRPMQHGSFAHD